MNEKVNIHTNKTLKVPEIPKQKHPVIYTTKSHGTTKQVFQNELLRRHSKSNIVFAKNRTS